MIHETRFAFQGPAHQATLTNMVHKRTFAHAQARAEAVSQAELVQLGALATRGEARRIKLLRVGPHIRVV